MFRKILSFTLAALMAVTASVSAFAENLSSGTPWIDSTLEGAMTEDMRFDLKDDFYAAVNGDWILQTEIPAGQSATGTAEDLKMLVNQQLVDLVVGENTDNDPYLAQVQSLYALYMDWDSRNEAGITPIMPVLNRLEAIQTTADLTVFLTLDPADRGYLSGPFADEVMTDLNDSSKYIVAVTPAKLFLGDSAEYLEPTEFGLFMKETFLNLCRKMLNKAGYSEERIGEIIANAMAFETAVAQYIPSADEKKSPAYSQSINNHVSRSELEELQGDLPLIQILLANGVPDAYLNEVLLTNPTWLEAMHSLYTEENVPGMRDVMILSYVLNKADSLDREAYEWTQELSNTLGGVTDSAPVEQEAISYVQTNLAWPLARAYVNLYFTQEDKDRIYQLCVDTIAAFKGMLLEEDFLSAQTIAYACEKLDALQVFSMYPDDDQWPDTSALSFRSKEEGGSFSEAVQAIARYSNEKSYARLGTTADRTRWDENCLPTDVNASNTISQNLITVYAAICQGGFYRSDMSTEELYGTIGIIIGHEVSHTFDSTGAQYDKSGNLVKWWTDEDYALFQMKVQKLMDYYSSISPWEGQYVHGNIVSGEALADMGGVKVMLRMAKSIPDFDYDLFFRSFANMYKEKGTMGSELSNLLNVHPMKYLRINVTLAQQDEFIEFYGIQEGDGMYIAPEDRVSIW